MNVDLNLADVEAWADRPGEYWWGDGISALPTIGELERCRFPPAASVTERLI
jgi:hypothetical protein